MASTWWSFNASRYKVTGSSANKVAAIPTLRNWSAAVLATATEVGSFDATPMTRDSCLPSLLIRPRTTSGGPVLTGAVVVFVAGGAGDAGDVSVLLSTWNPAAVNKPSAAAVVMAGGAVGS